MPTYGDSNSCFHRSLQCSAKYLRNETRPLLLMDTRPFGEGPPLFYSASHGGDDGHSTEDDAYGGGPKASQDVYAHACHVHLSVSELSFRLGPLLAGGQCYSLFGSILL